MYQGSWGAGGLGGGGSNSVGQINTGGGGSGGPVNALGYNGGSGVVIIKYPDTLTISVGAGLTSNTPPAAGGYKVTTFTAGSDTVSFS